MSTKLRFALLVAVLATLLAACGGTDGGVINDDPNYTDTMSDPDTVCNEVADDGETQYVCPTGHYFLAGSNPPCVLIVEDDPEVVDQCQPDPSLEGKDCGGCLLHFNPETCLWMCGQPPQGALPPFGFTGELTVNVKKICP